MHLSINPERRVLALLASTLSQASLSLDQTKVERAPKY